jgi:hypothetical protein
VGLSINEAAVMHRTDRTTVSNTESARSGVSSDRVRVWAANYTCPDGQYIDALADMARERGSHWWDEYRGSVVAGGLDLAEMEHHAHALRSVQITHMPGLLQHEDYARAVFAEAVPPANPRSLDLRLDYRMKRRAILDRDQPPQCTFLIHEAALRMQFGGRGVARKQLHHLLEQSDRDSVAIRVLPFSVGGFPSAGSSTTYCSGPVPQLDTVQMDTALGSAFLHSETHLVNYRSVLDRTEQLSLAPGPSRDFIHDVARQE